MIFTDPRVDACAAYIKQHIALDGGFYVSRLLMAIDAVDPLRQGDTVPVDHDLIKPLRDICRELGYLGLLRRLPNPDQEPQP